MPTDTRSPKDRFIESKDRVEGHRFIISHPQFDNSIDFALLQYADNLSRADVQAAGANHFKLVGAQEFIRALKGLSEIVEPKRTTVTGALNHNA